MYGEGLANKGQGQTFYCSSSTCERENLRPGATAREILGHLAPLLLLGKKKLS